MATEIATRSPAFVDGKASNAQELRLHVLSTGGGSTPLASRSGVLPAGGNPGLVAALATPVMKVRVNAGIAVVASASASGGAYRVSWDQVDLDIDVSSAQARTDLAIVEIIDTGTSVATGKVRILKGTSGAGRPTNGLANAHWFSLGAVAVRVGAESGGNIRPQDVTPERTFASAPGAPIPVLSLAERDALATAWGDLAPLTVQRFDVAGAPIEVREGSTWRRIRFASDTGWVATGINPAVGFGNRGGAGYRIIDGLHAYAQVTVDRTGADIGPANAPGNSSGGIADASLYTLPAAARPSTGQPVFGRAYAYFGSGTVMLEASGVVSLIDLNPSQIVPTGGLIQTYFAYVLG